MFNFLFHKDNRNFLRLWLAQLISQFGDRIHQLALVGLIAERSPGSALGLAKLLAFTIIPVFIIQPFAGVLVDRWDRRTTLFVCDLARGFLVLLIPFILMKTTTMLPVYIIVFLVFSFSRFYVPAKMSIIPDIVEKENLLQANSLITTTGMIAAALGAALGAFIIEWYGAKNGFLIDAATFFLSAVFLVNIRPPFKIKECSKKVIHAGKEIIGQFKVSVFIEIREGFLYIIRHREIRFIINILFVLLGAAGAVYVVIIVFIQETFHSATKHLGVIAIALVVGLFLGVVSYGRAGKKLSWESTIFSCLLSGGLMLVAFALLIQQYPSIWLAVLLAGILGLTVGPIFIAANTVAHVVSDESMRGKVFSALEIVIHLAFLTTMFISSWLSEYVGRAWILCAVGIICTGIGVGGLRIYKTKDSFLK
jgi:MFS family permease